MILKEGAIAPFSGILITSREYKQYKNDKLILDNIEKILNRKIMKPKNIIGVKT
nr:hypothetical protein [Methanobrevibacter arboriphilus]